MESTDWHDALIEVANQAILCSVDLSLAKKPSVVDIFHPLRFLVSCCALRQPLIRAPTGCRPWVDGQGEGIERGRERPGRCDSPGAGPAGWRAAEWQD